MRNTKELRAKGQEARAATKPVRAALYVRVSTQAQADRFSLPAQRKVLQKLAQDRGWNALLYDEGGVSAETIEARPVFRRLLDDVAAGRIDLVAVIEMERLCRASDLRDWARITTTFRDAGVLVATPERIFNLETAEDDFEADLRGILSKREKRKLLERTKRGIDEARDAGRFCGGRPPTGYKLDYETRKIIPDAEMVPVVERIFASDLPDYQLEKMLRREGTPITGGTIRRIRTNVFYLGLRPNSEGKLIPADWSPIISQELWERQQAGGPKPKPRGSAYLLSGMVRCRNCGGPVVGQPIRPAKDGTKLYIYRCNCPRRCSKPGRMLTGWLVDMFVVDALERYIQGPPSLTDRFKEALAQRQSLNAGDFAKRREELRAKAKDLEEREQRLVASLENGSMPERLVGKRIKAIAKERGELQLEIDSLKAMMNIPSLPDVQEILGLAEDLSNATKAQRRHLLRRLTASIEIDGPERLLVVRWGLGGESLYRIPHLRGGARRRVSQLVLKVQALLSNQSLRN